MALIADAVFDTALQVLTTNADRIDVCSQEPTTYAEATSTYTLGNDAVTTGSPAAGDTDGRKVVVAAITAGSVTGSATVTHWALTNGTDTLYATGTVTPNEAVTSGETFSLDAITITIRDAT